MSPFGWVVPLLLVCTGVLGCESESAPPAPLGYVPPSPPSVVGGDGDSDAPVDMFDGDASLGDGPDVFDPSHVLLAVSGHGIHSDHRFALVDLGADGRGAQSTPERQLVIALRGELQLDRGAIRPQDGRLIYSYRVYDAETEQSVTSIPRAFRCDEECVRSDLTIANYPVGPGENDPVLPTDCGRVATYLVSPEGATYFQCLDAEDWFDKEGAKVGRGVIFRLGRAGLALVPGGKPIGFALASLGPKFATQKQVTGLPEWNMIAVRSHEDGFWLAMLDVSALELWSVDPSGKATKVGSYPPPPEGVSAEGVATLDANGVLYQIGRLYEAPSNAIVRRDVQGKSEIVFVPSREERPLLEGAGLYSSP